MAGSLAIAEITGEDIIFEKVVIDNSGPVIDSSSLPKNIDSIIRKAMKLTDKGKGADDICRMYLTHPGIDVAGILQRIEGR